MFRPMPHRILVKPDSKEERLSAGGIIMAPSAITATEDGIVAAIGKEVEDVVPGDRISFLPYTGAKIQLDGEDFIVMRDDEVSFVVEE